MAKKKRVDVPVQSEPDTPIIPADQDEFDAKLVIDKKNIDLKSQYEHRKPKNILWITAGIRDNEAHVNLFSKMVKMVQWENCRHTLVTSAKNFPNFPYDTYHIHFNKTIPFYMQYEKILVHLEVNNMLRDVDMFIVGGWFPVLYLYLLTTKMYVHHTPPIVYVTPKIPEYTVTDLMPPENEKEMMFWYLVGKNPHIHAVSLDNDNDLDMARERMKKMYPQTKKDIHRLRWFKAKPITRTDREHKVIWQGRNNYVKNPKMALEICTILTGIGVKTEFYFSHAAMHSSGGVDLNIADKCITTVYKSLNTAEFIKSAGSAKVLLLTSHIEGQSLAALEMIQEGVIPVIWKKPWTRNFLTERYPLYFTNVEDGVAMAKEVLDNYDEYRKMMEGMMLERYAEDVNWHSIVDKIWTSYVADTNLSDYSITFTNRVEDRDND